MAEERSADEDTGQPTLDAREEGIGGFSPIGTRPGDAVEARRTKKKKKKKKKQMEEETRPEDVEEVRRPEDMDAVRPVMEL
jgi:hypothetical protein